MDSNKKNMLRIPVLNDDNDITIFADELGDLDYNDLIDLLRAELAPLDGWRKCAVRQHV